MDSAAVGIAIAEALHALGALDVRVKWPNDLIARDRKLGGVLIELAPRAAVIGLGLNLRMPDDAAREIDQPWIDLATLQVSHDRNRVAAQVLQHLLPALDSFDRAGLSPFLSRWPALDALAGRRVRVLEGDTGFDGDALGIAPDGRLRVHTAHGERQLHSADVSLRPA